MCVPGSKQSLIFCNVAGGSYGIKKNTWLIIYHTANKNL